MRRIARMERVNRRNIDYWRKEMCIDKCLMGKFVMRARHVEGLEEDCQPKV